MQDMDIQTKNIHAILQQRRLRHISGVCIRNLVVPPQALTQSAGMNAKEYVGKKYNAKEQKIYFTMKTFLKDDTGKLKLSRTVYESEHIGYYANLSWFNLDIEKTCLSSYNELFLQLWVENSSSENPEPILHWKVNLCRLAYIAEHLYLNDLTFSSNALVLKISGSFYSLPHCFSTESPHGNCPHFNVDEEKISCNVFSLKRIITCHCSIERTKSRTAQFISGIETCMQHRESSLKQHKEIEDLQTKIKRLKQLLSRETRLLKMEQTKLLSLQTETCKKKESLKRERRTMLQEKDHHNEIDNKLVIYRKRTEVFTIQLNSRRAEVLSELAHIFPISLHVEENTAKNALSSTKQTQKSPATPLYSICGIFLPDAENLIPKEDSKNAIAMGYVSQMVNMISYFLSTPLTYRLVLQGSQSSIIDHITEKLQEKERSFPLFSKNTKDRFLFEYAVYLLNKNIGQLLYHFDRNSRDLRHTLHNLKVLLEFSGQRNNSVHLTPPLRKSALRSPVQYAEEVDDGMVMNGMRDYTPGVAERMHDKSAELHTLRGELFAGTKRTKSIPVSPRRSAFSNLPNKQLPQQSPTHEVVPSTSDKTVTDQLSVASAQNAESAVLLTGLEDLDKQGAKNSTPKLDVVAARNELFSTKSGRSVYTKKHTYTMRTGGASPSSNYFSTKEQLFKKTEKTNSPVSASNGDRNMPEEGDGTKSTPTSEAKIISSNLDNNNLKTLKAPHATAEEIDLC